MPGERETTYERHRAWLEAMIRGALADLANAILELIAALHEVGAADGK